MMGSSTVPRDSQIINLNRILASQEKQLLSETSDPNTFKSRYDRARIRANFDYARSLLLTVSSTKQLPKDDVQRKRDLVKRLQARLNELDQLYAQDEYHDSESSDEDDQSAPSRSAAQAHEIEGLRQRATALSTQAPSQPQATTTSSSNRFTQSAADQFQKEKSALQTREEKLSQDNSEKDTLQQGLLDLAVQLKQSVRGFGAQVEAEKDTLNATVLGLDKGVGNMEGAGGSMKKLQRETEGAGWFRRMRLYGEVAGLWLLIVLLVFVFPKLRF